MRALVENVLCAVACAAIVGAVAYCAAEAVDSRPPPIPLTARGG